MQSHQLLEPVVEVVVTLSSIHAYNPGDTVDIYGVSTSNMNGRFTITEKVSDYVLQVYPRCN